MAESSGLPRRFLRPFLLITLQQVGRSYGYELCQAVRELGVVVVDLAGVYRELRSLEQRGAVCSVWEPSDAGPDRRVYELTTAGQTAARAAIDELVAIREGLDKALARLTEQAIAHP